MIKHICFNAFDANDEYTDDHNVAVGWTVWVRELETEYPNLETDFHESYEVTTHDEAVALAKQLAEKYSAEIREF